MKTVYIAGPMRGLPENNAKAFFDAFEKLRNEGWHPIDPTLFNEVFGCVETEELLKACMDAELAAIPHLDAIFLLKGWEESEGAKKELEVALRHGLKVMLQGDCP